MCNCICCRHCRDCCFVCSATYPCRGGVSWMLISVDLSRPARAAADTNEDKREINRSVNNMTKHFFYLFSISFIFFTPSLRSQAKAGQTVAAFFGHRHKLIHTLTTTSTSNPTQHPSTTQQPSYTHIYSLFSSLLSSLLISLFPSLLEQLGGIDAHIHELLDLLRLSLDALLVSQYLLLLYTRSLPALEFPHELPLSSACSSLLLRLLRRQGLLLFLRHPFLQLLLLLELSLCSLELTLECYFLFFFSKRCNPSTAAHSARSAIAANAPPPRHSPSTSTSTCTSTRTRTRARDTTSREVPAPSDPDAIRHRHRHRYRQ